MAEWDIRSLWDQMGAVLGLFAGGLAGLFLLAMFTRRVGDPQDPSDAERLHAQSPLNSATKIRAPLLIIQGDRDQTTLNEFLQEELNEMNLSQVQIEMFEIDRHVQIYQTTEYKERYTQVVNDFIRK